MNIYIDEDTKKKIANKWGNRFEFRGKPKMSRLGVKYIEAYDKSLDCSWYYVFGANSFVDKETMLSGANELIFE